LGHGTSRQPGTDPRASGRDSHDRAAAAGRLGASAMTTYRFDVNGAPTELDVPGMRRLLDVLREDLGLTGTKEGCGEGECGACSVILDGQVVDACLVPICQVDGSLVRTVEGLAPRASVGGPADGAAVPLDE